MSEPEHVEQLGLPVVDVAPEEGQDDDLETQSGLGKGLSAIIPRLAGLEDEPRTRRSSGGLAALIPGVEQHEVRAAESVSPPEVSTPAPDDAESDDASVRQLRDDLARALLNGLVNTMPLELCAYVHKEWGHEPELFLRSPAPSTLSSQRMWTLFTALQDAMTPARSSESFQVAGLEGMVIATGGSRSSGVFVLARTGDLTERERAVANRFCRSFGGAVHQLAAHRPHRDRADEPVVVVEVHKARDSVLARVRVAIGGRLVPGTGRADTQVEAVTRAVIDASSSGLVFRYASEVSHGAEHAAVVLLESPRGEVALGSAVTRGAGGRATALAALRAAAELVE